MEYKFFASTEQVFMKWEATLWSALPFQLRLLLWSPRSDLLVAHLEDLQEFVRFKQAALRRGDLSITVNYASALQLFGPTCNFATQLSDRSTGILWPAFAAMTHAVLAVTCGWHSCVNGLPLWFSKLWAVSRPFGLANCSLLLSLWDLLALTRCQSVSCLLQVDTASATVLVNGISSLQVEGSSFIQLSTVEKSLAEGLKESIMTSFEKQLRKLVYQGSDKNYIAFRVNSALALFLEP